MTTLTHMMFAGLWLAALAASVLILRNGGATVAAFAIAPALGAALATSLFSWRR